VHIDATLKAPSAAAHSGIATEAGNGSIVVRSVGGDLAIDEAVSANGSGGILLSASSALTANADVASNGGNISIISVGQLTVASGVTVSTDATGTIDLESTAGSIVMNDTALIDAVNGDVRLKAADSVTLGGVDAAADNDDTAVIARGSGSIVIDAVA